MQVEVMHQQDVRTPCILYEDKVVKPSIKANHQVTFIEGQKPTMSSEENCVETIENLLPDEEDLFSGLINESGSNVHPSGSDDEDVDLFSTGGGMELEGDCTPQVQRGSFKSTEVHLDNHRSSDVVLVREQPSRTLVVKDIDSRVEDSELRDLFKQYGDIRVLYTACRHQGFLVVSYYDIRAAINACNSLHNMPMKYGKLNIDYSKVDPSGRYTDQANLEVRNLDYSISNYKLYQIFGTFGDIDEICGTAHNHKLIKYYDIRAADAALEGLKINNILREHPELEVSRQGHARSSMQQFSHRVVQGELKFNQNPNGNSSPTGTVSSGVMASRCINDGYAYGVKAMSEMSVNALSKNTPEAYSCFTNSPSSVGLASVFNQLGVSDAHHVFDVAKLHDRRTSFLPHSFPLYHNSVPDDGVIHNSLSKTLDMTSDISLKAGLEVNEKQLHSVDSYSLPMEHLIRGSSRTGSLPISGHHPLWNNSNSLQHHLLNPMIWPHSPPVVNGAYPHSTPQLPVLFDVRPHVLYAISPIHKHHIISSPSGSLSREDTQHAYVADSPKMNLRLDPLRIVGFPGTLLHPSKAASSDISHIGGNCTEANSHPVTSSPKKSSHSSSGRGDADHSVSSSPTSFTRPKERMRKQSHRRHEASTCDADPKKYELDIERVLSGEDRRTTLMIKNIPNKYTSETLLAAIDEQNRGTYDFIYLPIDFKNKCNMGYAFINMIDPLQIVPFHKSFHGKKWEKFHSGKVACLAYARIQGKEALIAHFQDSSLMNEDKCCHPILFVSDGPNAGDQVPFPLGNNIHTRRYKTRCSVGEENKGQDHESSPSSVKG